MSAPLKCSRNGLIRFGGFNLRLQVTQAQGVRLQLENGKRILDFTSGHFSSVLGHGHPEIAKTLSNHAAQLDHLLNGMVSPPVVGLIKKLRSFLGKYDLTEALFLNSGTEANEAAIKMAKTYTGKFEIAALADSWHGMTGSALANTYTAGRRSHGPLLPGSHILPTPNAYRSVFRHPDGSHDWETELEQGWAMIDRASVGSLAAVIVEPILSDGGILTLPKGYLKKLKQCCEERDMLLIVDEAQTAMGRCGTMFAFEQEGIVPDILTLCKGFGNGFPVSAVVTTKDIEETSYEKGFFYYATHANDPMAAAVALRVLTVIERDNLAQRAIEAGNRLRAGLERLKTKYECIGDVRGRGLLVGLEVVRDPETKEPDPETAEKLVSAMTEDGLSIHMATLANGGRAFRIAPALVISNDEIDEGLSIMEGAFERVCHHDANAKDVKSISARP